MSRSARWIAAGLAVILAASALFLLLHRGGGEHIARITLDGEVVEEIDLDRLWRPRTFTVTGYRGFTNTIRAEHGRICVESASCPDQICVKQGYIEDGTIPIVCLPSRLIIEILGEEGEVDAQAG